MPKTSAVRQGAAKESPAPVTERDAQVDRAGRMQGLQRTAGNRAVSEMLGSGVPLEASTRAMMEARFGEDLSSVRLHVSDDAVRAARLQLANAFTLGRDIVFNEGRYQPHTGEGQNLLAHEIAHTIQQAGGRAVASPHAAETEAAGAGPLVAAGRAVSIQSAVSTGVQCEPLRQDQAKKRFQELGEYLLGFEQWAVTVKQNPDDQGFMDQKRLYEEKYQEYMLLGKQLNEPLTRKSPRMFFGSVGPAPALAVPGVTAMSEETKREHAEQAAKRAADKKIDEKIQGRRNDLAKEPTFDASHPSFDTKEGVKDLLVKSGVPAAVLKRPLTGFELELRTQKQVQLLDPHSGVTTPPLAADRLQPLVDPESGDVIGYAGNTGSDLTICDVKGRVVQMGDKASTPSAIQPDDVILIGGALVKVGAKVAAEGLSIAARRLAPTMLRQLRSVAAATAMGLADAAPKLAGELADQAIIKTEQTMGKELGSEFASRGTKALGTAGKSAIEDGGKAMMDAAVETGGKPAVDAGGKAAVEAGGKAAGEATAETGGEATAKAATNAAAKPLHTSGGAIWEQGRQVRGLSYEGAMAKLYKRMGNVRRVPRAFEGIDFVANGRVTVLRDAAGRRIGELVEDSMAISEKTLDLTGKSVQTSQGMSRAIRNNINKLYDFEGYSLKGVEVRAIKDKVLNVAIGPGEPTAAQAAGIQDAIDHAKLADVIINIFRF